MVDGEYQACSSNMEAGNIIDPPPHTRDLDKNLWNQDPIWGLFYSALKWCDGGSLYSFTCWRDGVDVSRPCRGWGLEERGGGGGGLNSFSSSIFPPMPFMVGSSAVFEWWPGIYVSLVWLEINEIYVRTSLRSLFDSQIGRVHLEMTEEVVQMPQKILTHQHCNMMKNYVRRVQDEANMNFILCLFYLHIKHSFQPWKGFIAILRITVP